ncbi:DUF72 domain-containing protein [Salinisphaera sp. T31B1]|uniref:DUF72 domain-containing protein n=1 Tax=Salinisphaera sp. T31B1 TaxID=727963 RepID=UPI003340B225
MNRRYSDNSPRTGALFGSFEAALGVQAAAWEADVHRLARALPDGLRLGTSSWHFPGWAGLVWDRPYNAKRLSREGLAAYARHPLLGTVGLDRGFYRALSAGEYAHLGEQVPDSFRFMVKAPAQVTDGLIRTTGGRARAANPDFLDADLAWRAFVEPASAGLGDRLGVLVFQISPLPRRWLNDMDALIDRLRGLLARAADGLGANARAVLAVEVRDPEWLGRPFVAALKQAGATYCLGLHPKMPPIDAQLPILRALWPGPFVCRWNLNPRHGAFGYESARADYAPFDQLIDPDPHTRTVLARVMAGTVGAGQPVYVTINNKAEGCAPRSVGELARAVCQAAGQPEAAYACTWGRCTGPADSRRVRGMPVAGNTRASAWRARANSLCCAGDNEFDGMNA